MLVVTSTSLSAQEKINAAKKIKEPTKSLVQEGLNERDTIPFAKVVIKPTFPGCEEDADLSSCLNAKIMEHEIENFNKDLATDLAKELGLEGIQRIMVMFTIDTFGDVTDIIVRGPHKEIEEETKRIIQLLPQFIPGKMKGKEIPVSYTLPIQFEV